MTNIETTPQNSDDESFALAIEGILGLARAIEANTPPEWKRDLEEYTQAVNELKKYKVLGEVSNEEITDAITALKNRLEDETDEQKIETLHESLNALELAQSYVDVKELDYDQIANDYYILANGMKPENGDLVGSQMDLPTARKDLLTAIEMIKTDAMACEVLAALRLKKSRS